MIELPEANVLANQISRYVQGKRIGKAAANSSPHKFAWYSGDPDGYNALLAGKIIGPAKAYGGEVEIEVEDMLLSISSCIRFHTVGEKLPPKHQLLLTFDDSTHLSVTIQMWGGIFCFPKGANGGMSDSRIAREKPSPLSDAFSQTYFASLFDENTDKLSTKAFLATEQRIPGLGNGALQDILWMARIHPKRKMSDLSTLETAQLFEAVKCILHDMTVQGGRDTERDLFGNPGGYKTVLSKNTVGKPCPACGTIIKKEPYMGGSIYYCAVCQAM
jgi:formamidopyrimidine-DNA glycosylase